jgi:hypothetical protein
MIAAKKIGSVGRKPQNREFIMYGDINLVRTMLLAAVFVVGGDVSLAMSGDKSNKQGEDQSSGKDAKMSVASSSSFATDGTKHCSEKDAKSPLTCGKLGAELMAIWEKGGPEVFNDHIVQLFRGLAIQQAEILLVPVSRNFLSKMSDDTIVKIMVFGGIFSVCLDCFQERLTPAIINRVVSLIISLCPMGAVGMIKILATDPRTNRMITAEAINKPFKTGSLVRSDPVDFATRLKILQLFSSLVITRNKVRPESLAKAESDFQIVA